MDLSGLWSGGSWVCANMVVVWVAINWRWIGFCLFGSGCLDLMSCEIRKFFSFYHETNT